MNTNRIAVLIKTASIEFDKMANPILADYDLTASQCRILKFLFIQQNQSARIVDIEKECVITHPTVLGLLDNLEKKGFVLKIANPKDGRSKLISLTQKAKDLQHELEIVVAKIDHTWVEHLSEQERKELQKLLQKLLRIKSEDE